MTKKTRVEKDTSSSLAKQSRESKAIENIYLDSDEYLEPEETPVTATLNSIKSINTSESESEMNNLFYKKNNVDKKAPELEVQNTLLTPFTSLYPQAKVKYNSTAEQVEFPVSRMDSAEEYCDPIYLTNWPVSNHDVMKKEKSHKSQSTNKRKVLIILIIIAVCLIILCLCGLFLTRLVLTGKSFDI
jgi:hypothetical protein